MEVTIHADRDDWTLTADGERLGSDLMSFTFLYYLTDESGNFLTDESGNRLAAYVDETLYPRLLHAENDDWTLTTE